MRLHWPLGHISCRFIALHSEHLLENLGMATERQKPQAFRTCSPPTTFAWGRSQNIQKPETELFASAPSDAWCSTCQKWHIWLVPPQASQRLLEHGPVPLIRGVGIRKSSLVNLLYKSKVMTDLQSGTESATAKAQASKSAPQPNSFVPRN